MFRCLLHHLQGDHCIIWSKTVCFLQCFCLCCAIKYKVNRTFLKFAMLATVYKTIRGSIFWIWIIWNVGHNPYYRIWISVGSCYLLCVLAIYVKMYRIYIYVCVCVCVCVCVNAEDVFKTAEVTEDWINLHIVQFPDCTLRQILSGL